MENIKLIYNNFKTDKHLIIKCCLLLDKKESHVVTFDNVGFDTFIVYLRINYVSDVFILDTVEKLVEYYFYFLETFKDECCYKNI